MYDDQYYKCNIHTLLNIYVVYYMRVKNHVIQYNIVLWLTLSCVYTFYTLHFLRVASVNLKIFNFHSI
ncbi:hypothetical protein C1646_689472 [Rhizophagus diaphanus]|nr:hypothetical protein C1646_689472 [Rhizophagus diaphanus] [Rhizophagus sp. MUCL 43196]